MIKRMPSSLLLFIICFSWLLCSCSAAVPASVIPKQFIFQALLTPFVFDAPVAQKGPNQRLLFLIDRNNHVVPWAVHFPKSADPVKQIIEALVKDGELSNNVPNGLALPLPPNTSINSVEYGDSGEVTIDLSPAFLEYPKQEETAVFEALTESLVQLKNVDRVKIKIDGNPLQETVFKHDFIAEGLSEDNGINLVKGPVADVAESTEKTIYLLSGQNHQHYYIPLTIRMRTSDANLENVLKLLMMDDWSEQAVYSPFNEGTRLTKSPVIQNKQLILNFNKQTLTDNHRLRLSDELLTCLALTFIDGKEVQSILVHVKDTNKKWEIREKNGGQYIYTVSDEDASGHQPEVSG